MTTKISPQKLSRLLRLHFAGHNQVQIGQKLGIDQSTVSLYISKFGMQAQEEGLMAASKEVGIMDIISALHSLGAELQSSKLSVEEARVGLKTRLKLETCGVVEDHYAELIEATGKIKEQGFLDAALKLTSLEKTTGTGYAEITAKYEAAISEIEQKSVQLDDLKAATAKQQSALKNIESEKKAREIQYNGYLKETGMNLGRLKAVEQVSAMLKQAGVKDSEMGTYIQRQQELDKGGIDINLFGDIASKTAAVTSKDGGKQLLNMLAEYGNLQATITTLSANKTDLENQAAGLSEKVNKKNQLVKEIAKLSAQKSTLVTAVQDLEEKAKVKGQLEYEIKSLNDVWRGTKMDTESLQSQKLALQEEVAATESKLTELQLRKTELEELTTKNAEMDKLFADKSKEYGHFQAFLGLLRNATVEALDRFVTLGPELVQRAKQGKIRPIEAEVAFLRHLLKGQIKIDTSAVTGQAVGKTAQGVVFSTLAMKDVVKK